MEIKYLTIKAQVAPEVLLETPYGVLLGNTLNHFPSPRKQNAGRVQVTKTVIIPSYDEETLHIKAVTRTRNKAYKTNIIFDDVEFLDEKKSNAATVIGPDGDEYYFKKIPLNRSDVKVSCTCLDFYYRFAVWNDADDSLIGNPPPPYVKVTDSPPQNPKHLPGVCKHIIKVMDKLMSQRMFK